MDEADEIIENIINEQSTLLWEWRSRIEALLTERLASGDEADGQEYARSLNTQGEAETYLQAYAALLADRREVLVAERTLLAAHDAKEKKFRHTKAASKAAAAAVDAELEIPGDVELQPEHEVLHKDLSIERKELLQRSRGRALRSVMVSQITTIVMRHVDFVCLHL
jgi:E3 ubiquitin-protein ligase SHPRH